MSFINKLKQKALPYIFGATIGLFGGCGDSGDGGGSVPPIVTGPVVTDEQGEADKQEQKRDVQNDEQDVELVSQK